MVWLLIIFCLAVAVSPLFWMKSSPRQQQVTECRKIARALTVNVNLCRRPDALESESRLDAIFYWIPWQQNSMNETWVLQRVSRRGWQSPFDGWRWATAEADKKWFEIIRSSLDSLPLGASAIIANKEGIGVVWDERGNAEVVENLHQCLTKLRKKGEEICV